MSIAQNIAFLQSLPRWDRHPPKPLNSLLTETSIFGSNPGDLRMFSFVPVNLDPGPPLVVVLHGCTQTAAGYEVGAGWSTLAERYGFALLMPEQKRSNNAKGCFNWFEPADTKRDSGEACSIRQMIERMAHDHRIDKRRVFITGLSAGGAMTSVMLATYPEVFAAGAVVAGLPFGRSTNLREALSEMSGTSSRSPHELGDLVRSASLHQGRWPKVSVWHGGADRTVHPANASDVVNQWLDVHGLPSAPMSEADVEGCPRLTWWDADGKTVVELYTIPRMAHGTPLHTGQEAEQCGVAGAFLLDVGISSSYHIANFFGLTGRMRRPDKSASQPGRSIDLPILKQTYSSRSDSRHRKSSHRATLDINAVITNALSAAGLIK